MLAALFVDGVALAAGVIGYHFLEGLDWLDASLNAALVMTGNGPGHPPRTLGGKLFTIFDALLGVIVFVAVIGVLLTPVFHRILHGFHRLHRDNSEIREQQTVAAGEHHSVPVQQFPAIKKACENGGDCGGVFVNPGGGQTIST